jgi:hypothetical protein
MTRILILFSIQVSKLCTDTVLNSSNPCIDAMLLHETKQKLIDLKQLASAGNFLSEWTLNEQA